MTDDIDMWHLTEDWWQMKADILTWAEDDCTAGIAGYRGSHRLKEAVHCNRRIMTGDWWQIKTYILSWAKDDCTACVAGGMQMADGRLHLTDDRGGNICLSRRRLYCRYSRVQGQSQVSCRLSIQRDRWQMTLKYWQLAEDWWEMKTDIRLRDITWAEDDCTAGISGYRGSHRYAHTVRQMTDDTDIRQLYFHLSRRRLSSSYSRAQGQSLVWTRLSNFHTARQMTDDIDMWHLTED
jgi:hypothetical protein